MANTTIAEIKRNIDKYNLNIETITAIIHSIRYHVDEENIYYSIRRKFECVDVEKNMHREITPDLFIQIDDKHFFIFELKLSIHYEENFDKIHSQLYKYNKIKAGWIKHNRVNEYEIGLIIHDHDKKKMKQVIPIISVLNDNNTNNNFVLSTRRDERNTIKHITTSLEHGIIKCDRINSIYKYNDPVKMSNLDEYGFYFIDQKPELPYIVMILWTNIFKEISKYGRSCNIKTREEVLLINTKDAVAKIREMHKGNIPDDEKNRELSVVKTSWIKAAMQFLCEIGSARKVNAIEYEVLWSKKVKSIDHFIKAYVNMKIGPRKKKVKRQAQLTLPLGQ